MANKCVVVTVLVLGLLAFVLGIAGALHSLKGSDISITNNSCSHPTKPGLGLGVIASLCILAAQITANAAARTCICCCAKRPSAAAGKWRDIVTLVCSWIFAICSFSNLLAGGIMNSSSYHLSGVVVNSMVVLCNKPDPAGYLVTGAITALSTTGFALIFYFKATSVSADACENINGVEIPSSQPYPVHGYPPNPPPYGNNHV